jgi:CBS domain-containing protein
MQQNMQIMTPNPECAVIDTPIVDALHSMHDGKFLHLPVVDRGKVIIYGMGKRFTCARISFLIWVCGWLKTDGIVVAVVDVIHVTHAAVATVSQVRCYVS